MAGFSFTGGTAEDREQKGGFLLPFLVLCVSLFLTIGIVVYHARGGVENPSSLLQYLVVGVYRLLGWSGSLIGLVLVLVWSLRACLGPGSVPKLRLRALGILGVILGAAGVSGTAGYMEGVRAGGWLGGLMAPRMAALFGIFGSILVFSILLVASLLLATNWLFWDEFRRLAEKKAAAAGGADGAFPLSMSLGGEKAQASWEPMGQKGALGEVSAEEEAELARVPVSREGALPAREEEWEPEEEEEVQEEYEEGEEETGVTSSPRAESGEWEEEEEEFEEEEEEEDVQAGAGSEEIEEEDEEEPEEEEEEEAALVQPSLFPEAELEEEEEGEEEEWEEDEEEEGEEEEGWEELRLGKEEEEEEDLGAGRAREEEKMVEPESVGAGGEREEKGTARDEIPRPPSADAERSVVIPRPERETPVSPPAEGGPVSDPGLLDRAAVLVMENGKASITMLQRKLQIRFAQASHLLDDLERLGVVGPYRGSLPREILMSPGEWEQVRATFRS